MRLPSISSGANLTDTVSIEQWSLICLLVEGVVSVGCISKPPHLLLLPHVQIKTSHTRKKGPILFEYQVIFGDSLTVTLVVALAVFPSEFFFIFVHAPNHDVITED